jgi:hypothetical protein
LVKLSPNQGAKPMRVAIMQPYLLPYIGYFQLMSAADRFVVYDNIEYTKQSWINRNRIASNGQESFFTLPLKAGSDSKHIAERSVAASFNPVKMLNKFRGAYQKAPFFHETFPLIETVFTHEAENLFSFIFHSLRTTAEHLQISDNLVIASEVAANHQLNGQERVIAICNALGATEYINPEGGVDLYSRAAFSYEGIALQFLQSRPLEYEQNCAPFLPRLSIIDVLMFNSRSSVSQLIQENFDYL